MFKTYRYIFSLLFFLAVSLEAKSLLYKVSSPSSTVYILGSIHLAKPELYPLDRAISHAYENSDVLVVEVDPSSQESMMSMQNTMIRSGIYSGGKSLKSELSAKTYISLKSALKLRRDPIFLRVFTLLSLRLHFVERWRELAACIPCHGPETQRELQTCATEQGRSKL